MAYTNNHAFVQPLNCRLRFNFRTKILTAEFQARRLLKHGIEIQSRKKYGIKINEVDYAASAMIGFSEKDRALALLFCSNDERELSVVLFQTQRCH